MKAEDQSSQRSESCCSSSVNDLSVLNQESSPGKTDALRVPKIKGDYKSRGLDLCHFCGKKFNVGERIPRIIVGCGHTFCTSCLSYFLRNQNIRCPLCRKLLKGLESIEKLPLNFNILYEVVTRDPLLASVNFEKCLQSEIDENDEAYERELEPYLCHQHDQRIKHFYCSEHPSIFCRECIKDLHNLDACYVVDLYEIQKMRKLQEQNNNLNTAQLKNRTDGASVSCVEPDSPIEHDNPLFKNLGGPNSRAQNTDKVKKALFKGGDAAASKPGQGNADLKSSSGYKYQQSSKHQQHLVAMPIDNSDLDFQSAQYQGEPKASQKAARKHAAEVAAAGQEYGSYDEESENESDDVRVEDGELNSAQKQQLKRDLLLMGYDDDEDCEDGGDEANARLIAGAGFNVDDDGQDLHEGQAVAGMGLLASYDQQKYIQYQEMQMAMQAQMAMKAQVDANSADPLTQGAQAAFNPLRVKKGASAADDSLQNYDEQESGEDMETNGMSEAEQFALQKKAYAQQLKQELLQGKKPAKAKPQQQAAPEEALLSSPSDQQKVTEAEAFETPSSVVKIGSDQIEAGEAKIQAFESRDQKSDQIEHESQILIATQSEEQKHSSGTESASHPLVDNGDDNHASDTQTPSNEKLAAKNNSSNSVDAAGEKQLKENTAPASTS